MPHATFCFLTVMGPLLLPEGHAINNGHRPAIERLEVLIDLESLYIVPVENQSYRSLGRSLINSRV